MLAPRPPQTVPGESLAVPTPLGVALAVHQVQWGHQFPSRLHRRRENSKSRSLGGPGFHPQWSHSSGCVLGFPCSSAVKNRPAMQETPLHFLALDPWRRDTPSIFLDFPSGSAGKKSASNAGDLGSIPGLGRSPGEGNGYPLQYSGLENSMDCIVQGGSQRVGHD